MTDLSELTTLGVGGPISRLVTPTSAGELVQAALAMWAEPEDWLLLGGGSNIVAGDDGFDGTVLRIATRGVEVSGTTLRAHAGEPWDAVVEAAVAHGLAGIEALSGIPGTAGAAPVQNIGAYGQQLSDVLVGIEFLDFGSGELLRLDAAELALGYRTSALKTGRLGVVVAIELALDAAGASLPIGYPQLADALGLAVGDRAPLAAVREAVLRIRRAKGMVLDAGDPDARSAGSFFLNPIVSESFARTLPSDAPRYPTEPETPPQVLPLGAPVPAAPASGEYLQKLSAAWLIEHAGIRRGYALPGSRAAISSKHTLAIVNRGGATALDVVQLAGFVQTRVMSEFGVALQPEPNLVGIEL